MIIGWDFIILSTTYVQDAVTACCIWMSYKKDSNDSDDDSDDADDYNESVDSNESDDSNDYNHFQFEFLQQALNQKMSLAHFT